MRALVAARQERAVTALGSRGNAARPLQVTEAEARAALRDFVAVAGVERWISGQPWEAVPGGTALHSIIAAHPGRIGLIPSTQLVPWGLVSKVWGLVRKLAFSRGNW